MSDGLTCNTRGEAIDLVTDYKKKGIKARYQKEGNIYRVYISGSLTAAEEAGISYNEKSGTFDYINQEPQEEINRSESAQERLAKLQLREVERRIKLEPSTQSLFGHIPIKITKETATKITDLEERRQKDAIHRVDDLIKKYELPFNATPSQIAESISIKKNKLLTEQENLFNNQLSVLQSKLDQKLITPEVFKEEAERERKLYLLSTQEIARDEEEYKKAKEMIDKRGELGYLRRGIIAGVNRGEEKIANIGKFGANVMNKLGTPVIQEIANLKPTAYSKDINAASGLEARAVKERSNRLMLGHEQVYTGEIGTAKPAIGATREQIRASVGQTITPVPVVSTVESPTKGFAETNQEQQSSPEKGMDLSKLRDTRYGTHL